MSTRSLQSSWIRATSLGWALGLPAIVLAAGVAERLGQQQLHTPVGAGMGLAIGYIQSRALRPHRGDVWPWFWSCVVGLSLPFIAADVAGAAQLRLPYSLHAAVVCGGMIVGLWQAILLGLSRRRGAVWVAASGVGWALAAGAVAVADRVVRGTGLRGIPGALAYLVLVALGGAVLAVVTGFMLVRVLPTRPPR
jgi:hypothetical protein